VSAEPEVLWVDIDKLLHTQHLPQQREDGVSSELEAQLVLRIIHRLVEVRTVLVNKVLLSTTIFGRSCTVF